MRGVLSIGALLIVVLFIGGCGHKEVENINEQFLSLLNSGRDNPLQEELDLDDMAGWYCRKMALAQMAVHDLASVSAKLRKLRGYFGKNVDFDELLFADTVDHPIKASDILAAFATSKPHWNALMDESEHYIGISSIKTDSGFFFVVYLSQLSDGGALIYTDGR